MEQPKQILLALSNYEWSCLRYVTHKFLRTKAGQFKKMATAVVVVKVIGEAMTATKHKHQCEACGTIWQHADAVSAWLQDEGMEEAHKCPNCDQSRHRTYSGRRSPQFEMQLGLKTVPIARRKRR